MLDIRRNADIHSTEGGWFSARWHFSFDHYRDPENDGIGPLRVFNDDRLVPGAVWPMHPHRDIEGLTYVVEGSFGHEDNVGGDPGPLPAGSVQRMTLGRGAYHSEKNASPDEPMRFIQVWILPDEANLEPEVEQKVFTTEDRTNRLLRVFSPVVEGASDGSIAIHGDASVFISRLESGNDLGYEFEPDRSGYLYVIGGAVQVGDEVLAENDAVKIYGPESLTLTASEDSELIMIDVVSDYEPVGVWAGR